MFNRLKIQPNQWMILVLAVMWALLLLYVNMPWLGHHDPNGVWLGSAARNLLIYGPAKLALSPYSTVRLYHLTSLIIMFTIRHWSCGLLLASTYFLVRMKCRLG